MTMIEDKFKMFANRLSKVYRHRYKQARAMGTSCYRLYDHDLPEFPICIELYSDKIYIAEYKRRHGMTDEEHEEWIEKTLEQVTALTGIRRENIFLRLRMRKPGRAGQYTRVNEAAHEFIVEENGLKFIINLTDYLDTGLFLDHRITRELVRKGAAGKRVLNLFAYTGSFSVYAAAGGAAQVDTVDLSRTYLNWAKRNMQLNGFENEIKYDFIHADVIKYLKNIPDSSYDMIILDPPTFSNSQRMEGFLDIQRDHVSLINDSLRALDEKGLVYFSTNCRSFKMETQKIKGSIKDITKATTPFDFEGKFSRWCYRVERGEKLRG